MSRGWLTRSASFGPPGAFAFSSGKTGAATTYPARAHACSSARVRAGRDREPVAEDDQRKRAGCALRARVADVRASRRPDRRVAHDRDQPPRAGGVPGEPNGPARVDERHDALADRERGLRRSWRRVGVVARVVLLV